MEDAQLVHDELVLIAEKRDRLDVRQAELLVLADRFKLWSHFNCVHIYELTIDRRRTSSLPPAVRLWPRRRAP